MIQSAINYLRSFPADKPWLVLGKGPSFDRIANVDFGAYYVLTLNHACKVRQWHGHAPDLALFIDIEAFGDVCNDLAQAKTPTALPWHPHAGCKPSVSNLAGYCELFSTIDCRKALAWLLGSEALYSFNALTARPMTRFPPLASLGKIVSLKFFSAEAAFDLLGHAGVRRVRSLGLDGGKDYAAGFDPKDRLANGRKSFDDQTSEIRRIVREHGISYEPL